MKAKYPKHMFHVLEPSLWPFFLAFGLFFFVSGMAFCMHYVVTGYYMLMIGLLMLMMTSIFWFLDMSREAVVSGYHTQMVSRGLKLGFLFFMTSEIMLFFGFFWAFFHTALSPSIEVGAIWPPVGLSVIPVFEFPFFNTFVLIISGFSVTWVHSAISLGSFKDSIDGFMITMFLGLFFMFLQGLEYYESTFNLQDGAYPSAFFMLTGLHGCHVIVGVCFLFICFMSLLWNHYLTSHYLSLVFAMWYWHFVDIVWMMLFLSVYCWGSW